MIKRLLSAFLMLTLLTGFLTACGGDDDDDDDDAAEAVEDAVEEEEGGDEEAMEGDDSGRGPAAQAFCDDLNDDEPGDTPVAEVEASVALAIEAQAEIADPEVAAAVQGFIDVGTYLIENENEGGDGVVTSAEGQAAAEEFPELLDASQLLVTYCS
jgi:hypothetical protein